MGYSENIAMLEEAAEQLMDVIDKIREGVRGTPERAQADAYIIPHLEGWLDGHEYMAISNIIERLESGGDDYDDDGDDYDDEGALDW